MNSLFIHVPRTGGTSIRTALGAHAQRLYWNHGSLFALTTVIDANKYFKFGFVRNPWIRAASWYLHCASNGNIPPFSETIKQACIDNFHSPDLYFRNVFAQKVYLVTPDGKEADFIGQFEHLPDELNRLCDALALPHVNLPILNQTPQKYDYRSMYTPESVDIIANRCKWEIDKFDYTFEGAT